MILGAHPSEDDLILSAFEADVERIFPQVKLNSGGYGYDFHVGTLGSNYALRNSQYFIDPIGMEYFHLTSYRNLFSIINTGCFRLYNLKNSDDPNELESFRDVGVADSGIDVFKDKTFVLSGCNIDRLANPRLWRKYGKVAIVYEFLNSSVRWNYFCFAGIKYSKEPAFSDFRLLLERYKVQYPGKRFSYETLPSLIAFHKKKRFGWEDEVRLMYVPPISEPFERLSDFKTSKHHTGYTQYIELPLYVQEENQLRWMEEHIIHHNLPDGFYNDKPQIKIKRIIFGDNEKYIDQQKFNELKGDFQNAFQLKLGYRVPVNDQLFTTGWRSFFKK